MMYIKLQKDNIHLGVIESEVVPLVGDYVSYFDNGGMKRTDKVASIVHDITGPLDSGGANSTPIIELE